MRTTTTYSLELGAADVDRLSLVNHYYNPGSRRLLASLPIANGTRIADIGCGQGEMTHWMAQNVGPAGSVVGLDVSSEQLALAARECPHPERVQWVCSAADLWDGSGGNFDVVYCRLLLMHVPDPVAVLRAMLKALRPGGALVIEAANVSALRYVPQREGADRWQAWWYRLGETIGASYRFSERLLPTLRSLNLEIESAQVCQPISYERGAKLIHPLGFEQLIAAYRDKAGADPDELAHQLSVFRDCIASPDTYVELYAMYQIVCRTPG